MKLNMKGQQEKADGKNASNFSYDPCSFIQMPQNSVGGNPGLISRLL